MRIPSISAVFIFVLCITVFCITDVLAASNPKERKDVILVLRPRVSATDHAVSNLIYASVLAGLQDSLSLPSSARDVRQFVEVLSEQAINDEAKQHIPPIVLFSIFASENVDRILKTRQMQAQQLRLARLLDVTIAELSPANYEVTLHLYDTRWRLLQQKRIGGCSEPLEELTASAREVASRLNDASASSNSPIPKIDLIPPTEEREFLVGTRITLDSCGVRDPDGDEFVVTWTSSMLPSPSHRRRVSILLDRPRQFAVKQQIGNSESDEIKITVVAPPKAEPTVEVRSATEQWRQIALAEPQSNIPASATQLIGRQEADQSMNADQSRNAVTSQTAPHSSSTPDALVIRLRPHKINNVRLKAEGVQANQVVRWIQVSGPDVGLLPDAHEQAFNLTTEQSSYYAFRLLVTAARETSEARISFLAVPDVHVDTRYKLVSAKVGEALLLDGSGSYDVLGDQLTYTWVVDGNDPNSGARIIDNHAIRPRFVADRPGTYHVTLYVRVNRKIDDITVVDVATSKMKIEATNNVQQYSILNYNSSTTRSFYRAGLTYEPTISSYSTIARAFSFRSLAGGFVDFDVDGRLSGGGTLGIALRTHDRMQVDISGRIYLFQNQRGNRELTIGGGLGISVRLFSSLWLQIKSDIGLTPFYNLQAQSRYEVVPAFGLAFER